MPPRQLLLRLRIQRGQLDAALPQHLIEHLVRLAEDLSQTLPESPIGDVAQGRLPHILLRFRRIDEAARCQRAALAPPVAIVVDAGDELRIARQLLQAASPCGHDVSPLGCLTFP